MLNGMAAASLAALVLAAPAAAAQDTSFAAPEDVRLEVHNRAGLIEVEGTDGDRVTIRVGRESDGALRVRRSGPMVRVSISERWREAAEDDEVWLRLEVPRRTGLRLQGMETAIRVRDVGGSVEARTVDEPISVRGPARSVRARSVDDDVVVAGARGPVELHTVDGDIRVRDAEGEVRAQSIDGDLVFRDVRSRDLEANTTDGDLLFGGPVLDGGEYRLATHDGDLWMAVASGTNASFEVRLHSGRLDVDFELPAAERERDGRVHRFVLGDGSAMVELRSYDGDAYLRRPGGLPERRMSGSRN